MPSIEFDEETKADGQSDRLLYAKLQKGTDAPFIIAFLVRKHIVKNEANARILLLIITVIVLGVSIYLMKNSFSGPIFIDKVTR